MKIDAMITGHREGIQSSGRRSSDATCLAARGQDGSDKRAQAATSHGPSSTRRILVPIVSDPSVARSST